LRTFRLGAMIDPDTHAPADQPYIVATVSNLRALVAVLLAEERELPVIGLTARTGESNPALPLCDVREIVGPEVPVYFIASQWLGYKLRELLAPGLYVSAGASRVWWPGLKRSSSPFDHPLIRDAGPISRRWLAAAIANPPSRRGMTVRDRWLKRVEQRALQLEQHLRKVKKERDEARRDRDRAMARAEAAERALAASNHGQSAESSLGW
jgi:hypothetical protein